jgi:uncharacterized protein (DUF983 family)
VKKISSPYWFIFLIGFIIVGLPNLLRHMIEVPDWASLAAVIVWIILTVTGIYLTLKDKKKQK